MKTIFKYEVFDSCDEFVTWQKDALRDITQISPMVSTLKGDVGIHKVGSREDGVFDAEVGMGCYVIYREFIS